MDNPDVLLTVSRSYLVGIGPLVLGLVIVTMLILAVWLGIRRRARGPGPPSPEEQPEHPAEPVGYETERRELNEVEQDGVRHLPYEMRGQGTSITRRKETDEERPTWDRGGSSQGRG